MSMFESHESKDGVRFSWNVLPTTKADGQKLHIPVAALYTPLKPIDGLGTVNYKPLTCTKCHSVLNPYCRVNLMAKTWTCPMCNSGNQFPPHYSHISREEIPPELNPQFTTLEYIIDSQIQVPGAPTPPIPINDSRKLALIFVLDTTIISQELKALTSAIAQSLSLIPSDAYIGLITYGKNVHVHELGFEDGTRNYVFRGNKEVSVETLLSTLQLKNKQNDTSSSSSSSMLPPSAGMSSSSSSTSTSKNPLYGGTFLVTRSDCELQLTAILDDLKRDSWPCKENEVRPYRCTGTALSTAVSLAEASAKGHNARIILLTGGVCTEGPGQSASIDLKEPMRQHVDLLKGKAPYFAEAEKYYTKLSDRAAINEHAIDIFACSLDQVGLAEMWRCIERTGGQVVLDDSFTHNVFVGSLKRLFASDPHTGTLAMGFGGEMTVHCSSELKVMGGIGKLNVIPSTIKNNPLVSDQVIGKGGGHVFKLGGMDYTTTACIYLEVQNVSQSTNSNTSSSSSASSSSSIGGMPQSYIQFVTKYKHCDGLTHVRVTTLSRTHAPLSTQQGLTSISSGFDQEAAAVAMTRWAVYRTQTEHSLDTLRWLDKVLIKLVSQFANYSKSNIQSFRLSDSFAHFPHLLFHLRRSQLLQVFNSSPDETAFFRLVALHEDTSNTTLMINPKLVAYYLDPSGAITHTSVPLEITSMSKDRILLLDTFFHLVVWYGSDVATWQQQQLHQREGYAYLADFLKASVASAAITMEQRFPTPRFIECVERGSQQRFLTAKLNPSISQEDLDAAAAVAAGKTIPVVGSGSDALMFSEDVTLQKFLQHLRSFAFRESLNASP